MRKIPLSVSLAAIILIGALLMMACSDKINPVSPKWRSWEEGDTVPGYLLANPSGSRADVEAKAQMWDDFWALEVASDLSTGHFDDHIFVQGFEMVFALYISDASDSVWNGQHVIHLVWSDTDYESADTVSVYDLMANGRAAPTIDGDGSDEAWSAGAPETKLALTGISGDNGLTEAYLMAVHDSSRIYFKLAWPDPTNTMSMQKDMWRLDGRLTWTRQGEEDMAMLFFPMETEPTDWETLGGETFFPGDGPDDGSVNVWRWSAGRTNPLGWADDLAARESRLIPDGGQGAFSDNYDPNKTYPPHVQDPTVEPSYGPEVLLESEAIPFEETIRP